jgi:curved DNA-binding protein CbpA
MAESDAFSTTYYQLLGLQPNASVQDIRRAYRDLSKLYHPDTTALPAAIATRKFQALNEAYATLSSPESRQAYNHKIGYSTIAVMQPAPNLNRPRNSAMPRSANAYIDATDRPLSAGELFALFILGVTFVACLVLVVAISLSQGQLAFSSPGAPTESTEIPVELTDFGANLGSNLNFNLNLGSNLEDNPSPNFPTDLPTTAPVPEPTAPHAVGPAIPAAPSQANSAAVTSPASPDSES